MRKDDVVRLKHILDAAEEALSFTRGITFDDLVKDRKLVLALVKEVEIVGEAAYQVSHQTRQNMPEIPWDDIVGMRNRLVHAYFDIDEEILWATVQEDLPQLASILRRILAGGG